jgi:hypothetical protein
VTLITVKSRLSEEQSEYSAAAAAAAQRNHLPLNFQGKPATNRKRTKA